MLTTLLSILTNRILWSFLGVTALAAVIWMIGPLLSIVDTRPLESEQNRIISIAVVYLLFCTIVTKLQSLLERQLNAHGFQ